MRLVWRGYDFKRLMVNYTKGKVKIEGKDANLGR